MSERTSLPPLPRGDAGSPEKPDRRTAHWLHPDIVNQALGHGDNLPDGRSPLILGLADTGERSIIAHDDDRHAVLIVGSRGGKSVSILVPNLLTYPGSVIVTDPKGELAAITARHRKERLGQNVIILDAFNVLAGLGHDDLATGAYNPLEWLVPGDPELIDDIAQLADAIMVKEPRDVHFYESGRAYLKAAIGYLLMKPEQGIEPDLLRVREMVMNGDDGGGIPLFVAKMMGFHGLNGAVSRSAAMLHNMGERELGSVISTVGRNTELFDSPAMMNVLSGRSSFDPSRIKSEPTTIYLVMPEWRLGSHHRWLRLMISSLLAALQRSPIPPPPTPATMLLLDEVATLGHLESIERAAGYIAGFGVKLVTVLQDLNQLKALYQRGSETFLGNAGVVIAFANADTTTAEYLSRRCGETVMLEMDSNLSTGNSRSISRGSLQQQIATALSGDGLPVFEGLAVRWLRQSVVHATSRPYVAHHTR